MVETTASLTIRMREPIKQECQQGKGNNAGLDSRSKSDGKSLTLSALVGREYV
jgi:hypothetical protein